MSEVNGAHNYDSSFPELWYWDPSITDAMLWAQNIHDAFTVAQISAYNY